MPPSSLQPYTSLRRASSYIVSATRRSTTLNLTVQPGFRPLHASPIFQNPRTRSRKDFFSSNASLKATQDTNKDTNAEVTEDALQRKRKPVGSTAAKTSLRRVAAEAQRSQAGKSPLSRPSSSDTAPPKLVTAYAVAERFDLSKVNGILRAQGYEPDPLNTGLYPQVQHVQIPISSIYRSTNTSPRDLSADQIGDIFIFPSGTAVTWALPEGFTSYFVTRTLAAAAVEPYKEPIEEEDLEYIEDPSRESSTIKGDTIILGTKSPNTDTFPTLPSDPSLPSHQSPSTVLTKIAFSSGIARSTALANLETSLQSYLDSTSAIPRYLSQGYLPRHISRKFILRKTGTLLLLRSRLNLYSELTDSLPDIFWDTSSSLQLESYFDSVGRALDVGVRIKLLNEKMDYAAEIAEVLRGELSGRHGLWLEWVIILLIAVEVVFGVIHLAREGFWGEVFGWADKRRRVRDRQDEEVD